MMNALLTRRFPVECTTYGTPAAAATARGSWSTCRRQVNMSNGTLACAEPTSRNPGGRTGTVAGYLAHRRARETACGPCKKAETGRKVNRSDTSTPEYVRYRQALRTYTERFQAGEPLAVCAKPSLDRPEGRTGTRPGYMAHYYAEEPACEACLAGSAAQEALARAEDPEKTLRNNLWYKYRLTLEDYQQKLADQDHKCAVCQCVAPKDPRTDRFHVDHDHSCCPGRRSCGKCNRGLLCHACNTALGNLGDDADRLMAAAAYLLSYKNVPEVLDARS